MNFELQNVFEMLLNPNTVSCESHFWSENSHAIVRSKATITNLVAHISLIRGKFSFLQ